MKLIIQIPCYNEAQSLAETLADLPRELPGIDRVLVLVIDDGSTDGTADTALAHGADYVVRHLRNLGLARAFATGLDTALALGADVVVNTDADHQYPGRYVADLVAPILAREADVVIGDRQPAANPHFGPLKRLLQVFGTAVVRRVSNTGTRDAPSGFRAYSRAAAMRLHVHTDYSYTLETLIQAGREGLALAYVPIRTNETLRPSRLHRGNFNFIWRQTGTIIRSYVLYQPLKTFGLAGIPFLLAGIVLVLRFLYFYLTGASGVARYVQSVTIGGTLFVFGFLLLMLGLLGDAVRVNRQLVEAVLYQLQARESPPPAESISGAVGRPILAREQDLPGDRIRRPPDG